MEEQTKIGTRNEHKYALNLTLHEAEDHPRSQIIAVSERPISSPHYCSAVTCLLKLVVHIVDGVIAGYR